MKLPNTDRAIVDVAKLRDYCLNPNHEEGQHKARLFAASLGLHAPDAEWIHEQLFKAAVHEDATLISHTRLALYTC